MVCELYFSKAITQKNYKPIKGKNSRGDNRGQKVTKKM